MNEGEIVLTNGEERRRPRRNRRKALARSIRARSRSTSLPASECGCSIGSEATIRFFRLRLTGRDTNNNVIQIPLVRVGGEGGILDHGVVEGGVEASGFNWKFDEGEVLLDPGDRMDVVAVFPSNATGVFTLWTKDFPRTGGAAPSLPTVPVAHFNITGSVAPAACDRRRDAAAHARSARRSRRSARRPGRC